MRDCAKGVFDGWSLTPEFYALPIHGIPLVRQCVLAAPCVVKVESLDIIGQI